jgi:hypothetical protein
MLEALKASNEPEHLVQAATRYLKGLKGNLVQIKKQKQLKAHAARESAMTCSPSSSISSTLFKPPTMALA